MLVRDHSDIQHNHTNYSWKVEEKKGSTPAKPDAQPSPSTTTVLDPDTGDEGLFEESHEGAEEETQFVDDDCVEPVVAHFKDLHANIYLVEGEPTDEHDETPGAQQTQDSQDVHQDTQEIEKAAFPPEGTSPIAFAGDLGSDEDPDLKEKKKKTAKTEVKGTNKAWFLTPNLDLSQPPHLRARTANLWQACRPQQMVRS